MKNRISKLPLGPIEANCYILFGESEDTGESQEAIVSQISTIDAGPESIRDGLRVAYVDEDTSPLKTPDAILSVDGRVLETDGIPAMIIDPGGDCDQLRTFLDENGLKPALVVLTHSHVDHIACASEFDCPVAIHSNGAEALADPDINLSINLGKPISLKADIFVREGSQIVFNNEHFYILHTPGHSPDSICILGEKVLFSGDTLFQNSFGRFDLPGGDISALRRSLQRLLNLPFSGEVLPGHGPDTTLEDARGAISFFL